MTAGQSYTTTVTSTDELSEIRLLRPDGSVAADLAGTSFSVKLERFVPRSTGWHYVDVQGSIDQGAGAGSTFTTTVSKP